MNLSSIQSETINGLLYIESDLGNNTITWNGNSYIITPSVNQFERKLETGGFILQKALNCTVRKYNANGTSVFSGDILPSPQQKIVYNGTTFRIIQTISAPTNTHFRLICVEEFRGI